MYNEGAECPFCHAKGAEKEKKMVIIEMDNGAIMKIELDPKAAPITVANFKKLVKEGFYDGLIFHRVIKGFMIQGGGFNMKMEQKATHAPIKIEADNGLHNERGTIAMARTMDPNSATAQFFINTVNNPFLDYSSPTTQGWGYCVFGKVIEGMDTVDKIEKVKTGRRGMHDDVPTDSVVITGASIFEA
jgi:peptidyl-prolyl cis-trans isomerase B (cyclophilin B)